MKRQTKQSKIRNAKALIIDGISFKSKLEAYCYKKLKDANLSFKYEGYVFVLQDKFKYPHKTIELVKYGTTKSFKQSNINIREITYKPDFVSTDNNWVIECKGYPNDTFAMKWKMFKYFLYKNNMKVDLYVPRNHKQIDETIEMIKHDIRERKKNK